MWISYNCQKYILNKRPFSFRQDSISSLILMGITYIAYAQTWNPEMGPGLFDY